MEEKATSFSVMVIELRRNSEAAFERVSFTVVGEKILIGGEETEQEPRAKRINGSGSFNANCYSQLLNREIKQASKKKKKKSKRKRKRKRAAGERGWEEKKKRKRKEERGRKQRFARLVGEVGETLRGSESENLGNLKNGIPISGCSIAFRRIACSISMRENLCLAIRNAEF